jgi:hypothetical protein
MSLRKKLPSQNKYSFCMCSSKIPVYAEIQLVCLHLTSWHDSRASNLRALNKKYMKMESFRSIQQINHYKYGDSAMFLVMEKVIDEK